MKHSIVLFFCLFSVSLFSGDQEEGAGSGNTGGKETTGPDRSYGSSARTTQYRFARVGKKIQNTNGRFSDQFCPDSESEEEILEV